MTVKQQVNYELIVTTLAVLGIVAAVCAGGAALYGRLDLAATACVFMGTCVLLAFFTAAAAWANAQEE